MLRSLFILAILVPGFFAALRDRYVALLMYLWFALFRPQDWIWFDITSLRLSLVLGVVLVLPSIATGVLPNLTHPLSAGMFLFFGSSLLSQMSAVNPDLGWLWVDFLFRLFLTCLLLVTIVSAPRRLVGVVAVMSSSLGFHAAKAGLAYVVAGGTRFSDGLSGAFIDNNGYALGTVMIMPLLVATAQNVDRLIPAAGRLRRWVGYGFYLSCPLCVFAVIGTYSRGGFLALIAASLVFLMLQRRRVVALTSLVTIVAVLLAVVPIPESYTERLRTIRTYEALGEDSALSRPHFWTVGLNMALSRPLGVGLRQYEAAYDQYDFLHGRFGHRRSVHSSHVQVLAELGFFGAAVWASMFLYAIVVCLRVRARSHREHLAPEDRRLLFTVSNALLTSMAGFIVGGAFVASALNDITWLTFATVAAVDRLSAAMCEERVSDSGFARRRPLGAAEVPIAFRLVDSFATVKRGK